MSCLQLRPHKIEAPEPPEHWKKVGGLTHLLTQLACPGIHRFYFGRTISLRSHQRWTQQSKLVDLALEVLGSYGERPQHFQPSAEMGDGFCIRGAIEGILPGALPVHKRLCAEPRFGIVMREPLG